MLLSTIKRDLSKKQYYLSMLGILGFLSLFLFYGNYHDLSYALTQKNSTEQSKISELNKKDQGPIDYSIIKSFGSSCVMPSGAFCDKNATGARQIGDGEFHIIFGMAVDSSDNIYVVDSGVNDRIQKFTNDGNFVTTWGNTGNEDGQFNHPNSIATDPKTNIVYVSDEKNHRIQKFSNNGTFLDKWNVIGVPDSLTVDPSGNVYSTVQIGKENYIEKFDSNGVFIDFIFQSPTALGNIAADNEGNIYLADYGENIIKKLDGEGKLLATIGKACIEDKTDSIFSKPSCQNHDHDVLLRPLQIAIDKMNNMYVGSSDPVNDSSLVIKFDKLGNFVTKIDSRDYPMGEVEGITIDSNGKIYLASTGGSNNIKILSPK